ncbi:uncharacterized protein V6R79_011289 [Siganus canaliculatus]
MESMEMDDNVYLNPNSTMDGLINRDFQRPKQRSRCLNVSLVLLCAVLLAANLGQIIYYEIISRVASADSTQAGHPHGARLQSTSEALTSERKELEARLTNLTNEKDQLEHDYHSLTAERNEFKVSLDRVTSERDLIQARYNASKQDGDQLQASYEDVQRNLQRFQSSYRDLTTSREQLQTNFTDLQRQRGVLQTTVRQLQSSYSLEKNSKEQLQRNYNALQSSKVLLQKQYDSLLKDRSQLQTSSRSLQQEKQRLLAEYYSVVATRDQLQKKMDRVRRKRCQTGWMKFDISCYFVSSEKKNWTTSREDCITRGADLVVVDDREEQTFINKLTKSANNVWIGLHDTLQEGTWMWVDGTPVNITFWQAGQPNSFNGNQDCGELVSKSPGVGEWNDDGCFAEQIFVCEQ